MSTGILPKLVQLLLSGTYENVFHWVILITDSNQVILMIICIGVNDSDFRFPIL